MSTLCLSLIPKRLYWNKVTWKSLEFYFRKKHCFSLRYIFDYFNTFYLLLHIFLTVLKSLPPHSCFLLNKSPYPLSAIHFAVLILRMFPSRGKSTTLNCWMFHLLCPFLLPSVMFSFLTPKHSCSFSYFHFKVMFPYKDLLSFPRR